MRLDSITRHLKLNHHSKRARDVTNYVLDFLNSPEAKAPIETRPYQADRSTSNSYIYQQTMPQNKEMFRGYCMLLIQPQCHPEFTSLQYLLMKDPINIPFNSTDELKDPRLDYYLPRTSPSLKKDYSELDAMLHTQQETEGFTTTTEEPTDDTTLQAPEEETPATEWIILDSIGNTDDF